MFYGNHSLYCIYIYHLHTLFSWMQSDKASILDEAIEYLKSLQLQVQVSFFLMCFVSVSNEYIYYLCRHWIARHDSCMKKHCTFTQKGDWMSGAWFSIEFVAWIFLVWFTSFVCLCGQRTWLRISVVIQKNTILLSRKGDWVGRAWFLGQLLHKSS